MIIDEGSNQSLLDPQLALKMGFKGKKISQIFRTPLDEKGQQKNTQIGSIFAKPISKDFIYEMDVVTQEINHKSEFYKPKELKAAFPSLRNVDLLEPAAEKAKIMLGFDNQHLLRNLWTYPTFPNEPYCAETEIWGPVMLYHPNSAHKSRKIIKIGDESYV